MTLNLQTSYKKTWKFYFPSFSYILDNSRANLSISLMCKNTEFIEEPFLVDRDLSTTVITSGINFSIDVNLLFKSLSLS